MTEQKYFKISAKEYNSLVKKANQILSDLNTGHSMGCYRKFYIKNKPSYPFAENDTLSTYANSCKWKPTYGYICIEMTMSNLRSAKKIKGQWIFTHRGEEFVIEQKGKKEHHQVVFIKK